MPYADTDAMNDHLAEIAQNVALSVHAVVLIDGAGWHTAKALRVPANITLLKLPAYCPELNARENIWQYMRQTWLSNRIFENYQAIRNACCDAWNKLIADPKRITSIGTRQSATLGQNL
jgi:transposase